MLLKNRKIVIPFNKPFIAGNEIEYIKEAVYSGKISGDGEYSKKCQSYFEEKYGFKRTLLTTSCTDALEMASLLCNIAPGDEVILPSYTFVSTANAFALRGAKLVFADSMNTIPNFDPDQIQKLISPATKAIVTVHYGGMACMMDEIMAIANSTICMSLKMQHKRSIHITKGNRSVQLAIWLHFHSTKPKI